MIKSKYLRFLLFHKMSANISKLSFSYLFLQSYFANNCNKYSFVGKVKHYLFENLTWVSNTITMLVDTKRKVVMG